MAREHRLRAGCDTAGLLARASRSFLAGELAEAAQACAAVLDRVPGHPAAQRQLGLVHLVCGDPAACQALLLPLRDVFADDPDIAIALAESTWAMGDAADAIAHYRRALALVPDRSRVRARLGLALLTAGEPAAAAAELQAALHDEVQAAWLTHLGMALLAAGQPGDAVAALTRAVDLDCHDPGSAFHLGQALREAGRIDEALAALAEAVRRGPHQAHLHLAYGDALFARGSFDQAKRALRQAAALDPAMPLAWARLGDVEQLSGDGAAALGCYRAAAALDGGDPALLALLGNALVAAGDPAGNHALDRSMRATWAAARPSGKLRVGILAAPGDANTPTGFIVDRTRFAVSPIYMLDGSEDLPARLAGMHDVLFNAVSDPDAAPLALAKAAQLVPALGLPVVNPPDAISATTRERMAGRLSGIAGLHVPPTRRVARTDLIAMEGACVALFNPVLVRPAGSHGGRNLVLAQTMPEVQQAAAAMPSDEVTLTEFVDFRSQDGLYRKLRIMFVGGQAYPVHLAIGDHWLSHYYRTGMAEMAGWRAEEAAFLSGHEAYLGRTICRTLGEVQARVGLDYFGIDGAIGRDGRFVVFECNAAMLVRQAERPSVFDYKREPVERVRAAVGDMLVRLARRS